MNRIILPLLTLSWFFWGSLNATIINIPDDYPAIQQGIDASVDGDTVLVQPGYYIEHIGFGGHNIVLASLFLTTGDSSYIWDTSIGGDSSGTVVSFVSGEDTTAMLFGFSIENGADQSGGGIYCGNQSNPTIMSNLIMDNHAIPYTGGGIWCRASNPRIIGNIIRDNTAESGGGGISLLDSNPLIKDNVIFFNSGGSHGGGILCVQSNPTILNNRIYGNYAPNGGGIGTTDSDPVIAENLIYENVAEYGAGISLAWWSGVVKNNIIYSNLAVEQGGGVVFHHSSAQFVNNVICGNVSETMAGAVSCLDFSAPDLVNTIIWDNNADSFAEIFVDTSSAITISYSDIRYGWEGEGNIDIDPLFRDAANGDFHLRSEACDDTSNSPCIDVGSPAIIDSLLDCDWGLETILSDMGAYGGGVTRDWNWTVNVPDDYATVQQGITHTIDGDTVLVQPGIYVENINFNGHNIVLGSLFLTTGDTSFISQTIIDGGNSGTVVLFENNESEATVLTGFTVTGGLSELGTGGIHCENSSPTIRRNIITQNSSEMAVGGIRCTASSPLICDNLIDNNSGRAGAIGCLDNSNPYIAGNMIINNAGTFGGGIYCWQSSPTITQNLVSDNEAFEADDYGYGGGICCRSYSSPLLSKNTIRMNGANYGGALFCEQSSNPNVTQNVIYGNFADAGGGIRCKNSNPVLINNAISMNRALQGGGISCVLVSVPIAVNCIFWADSASNCQEIDSDDSSSPYFIYCDVEGGWSGEGNIDIDPLFRDAANGDFHLRSEACDDTSNSPCIDVGSPAIIDSLLDCDWGLETILSDMGTYGGGDSLTVAVGDHEIDLPDRFSLFRNYPNPFNAATVIRYALPEPGDIRIELYNILGRKVSTVFDGYMQAGYHSITWNASAFPSGVYFARLDARGQTESIKMILLK